MESKQAFGSYIKEKRQAKGLSQRDLAQKLYVTESAVSKVGARRVVSRHHADYAAV